MLNINSTIVQDDIMNVTALAPGHPVFKIEGYGDDNGVIDALVVKQEAGMAKQDVRFATGLMNVVDPNAHTVLLKSIEVAELKAWCSFWCSTGSPSHIPDIPTARALQQQLANAGAWTKMEVKRLTMLDNAIDSRFQGDKADVRVIARALRKPGGLEKLGEIITVDLFNGSSDRIVWLTPGYKHPSFPVAFKTLGNVGNVFIACGANGRGVPIGLDGFDPFNQYKDMNTLVDPTPPSKPPTQWESHLWSGHLLTQQFAGERKKFVGDVVADLEMALGPRHRKNPFGTKKRLGSNRKERMLCGMASGETKLKNELTVWRGGTAQIPVGLADRMTILGW